MRQFDIVKLTGGDLAVVLQSDLLRRFSTRVVVPLLPLAEVDATPRLHPIVQVGRRRLAVAMEQIVSVRSTDIVKVVGTARSSQYEIQRAYDIILAGL